VIPIAMPLLAEDEAEAARAAALSGWASQGQQVAAFEREFAAVIGAAHACAAQPSGPIRWASLSVCHSETPRSW
jgi:dTDP-4-amino-4,6-dideoxygalactose transaminase